MCCQNIVMLLYISCNFLQCNIKTFKIIYFDKTPLNITTWLYLYLHCIWCPYNFSTSIKILLNDFTELFHIPPFHFWTPCICLSIKRTVRPDMDFYGSLLLFILASVISDDWAYIASCSTYYRLFAVSKLNILTSFFYSLPAKYFI